MLVPPIIPDLEEIHSIPEIINAVPKIKQGAATAGVNRDCSEL